jgi:hypothetical protein
MTNVMHKFLINQFTSALRVSGFLLAHLQKQVYSFGSDSTLLSMVSAPGRWHYTQEVCNIMSNFRKIYLNLLIDFLKSTALRTLFISQVCLVKVSE